MSVFVSRIRILLVAAATVLALAGAAPAARADILGLPGTGCPDEQFEHPFTSWGDTGSYVAVPGGSFEPGAPTWASTGGAQLVADNEPWGAGQQALALPPGASATSPATCVSLVSPTLRFFAKSNGSTAGSSLRVNVLFASPLGLLGSLAVGTVSPSGAWQPTPSYLMLVNALAPVGSDYRFVAFQFIPQGSASWEIDDVYVDPWSKG